MNTIKLSFGLLAILALLGASACNPEFDTEGLVLGGDVVSDGDVDGDVDGDADGDVDGDADADDEADGDECLMDDMCNGEDEDCDPETEDGSSEVWFEQPCDGDDEDECEDGVFECVAGEQVCNDDDDSIEDLCNGEDDDCNPETPDGSDEEWYDSVCDGDDADECEDGLLQCDGTGQICVEVGDDVELCNGLDDDCDPETPDGSGEEWYEEPCDGDDSDACEEGTYSCGLVGETYDAICSDETDDEIEICNGADDDCDEEIDEGDWDGDGVPRCGTEGVAPDCNDNDPNLQRCDCLILGNVGYNRIYRRWMRVGEDDRLYTALNVAWTSPQAEWTRDVAVADWDDDGDHDLAVASGYVDEAEEHSGTAPIRIFENVDGVFTQMWSSPSESEYFGVSWWDWLGSGVPGIAVSQRGGTVDLYANRHPSMTFAGRATEEFSYGGRMDWASWDSADR